MTDTSPTSPKSSSRMRLPLLLIGLVLLAFGRLGFADFVTLDDPMNLTENPRQNPPTAQSVLAYWKEPLTGFEGLYIPVTHTIWAALAKATWVPTADDNGSHFDARIFHVVNIAAHALTACLVFALLKRLLGRPWAAFAGAALFALHPLQVESVGWVSGLKDVLCGLFAVAALNQYVAAAQLDNDDAQPSLASSLARGGSPGFLVRKNPGLPPRAKMKKGKNGRVLLHSIVGLLAFVIAMLCKPTAMVTPALAVVIDLGLLRRPLRKVARYILPWLIIATPFVILARLAQSVDTIPNVPFASRPLVAADSIAFYLWKFAATYPLIFDYNLPPQNILHQFAGRIGWILPVLLAVIAWWRRKKEPVLWVALLLFIIPLLPNSGVATFQYMYYSVVADHYAYLAMLGPALLVAWVAARYYKSRVLRVAGAIVLVALAARTFMQAGVWQDNFTLTRYSIAHNPFGFLAHGNLGPSYDARSKRMWDDGYRNEAIQTAKLARAEFETSVRLKPDDSVAWLNLIGIDLRLGNDAAAFREAKEFLQSVRFRQPRLMNLEASIFWNLSIQALADGRSADSLLFLERAVALRPDEPRYVGALKKFRSQFSGGLRLD